MARVKNGFLGDLSGSVGNVTFARARGGIQTARIRASPGNPRSPAQQQQRGRFKQKQRFASAFLSAGLTRPFWKTYATNGRSAYNAFSSANSAAMDGDFDPSKAVISRGNGLAGITLTDASVSIDDPNTYVLSFDSNAGGEDDDLIVGVIYNGLTWQAVMAANGALRSEGVVNVAIPPDWLADADALFAYAFAYQVAPNRKLRSSDSSMLKVTTAPFTVPEPEVPPPAVVEEQVYGQ